MTAKAKTKAEPKDPARRAATLIEMADVFLALAGFDIGHAELYCRELAWRLDLIRRLGRTSARARRKLRRLSDLAASALSDADLELQGGAADLLGLARELLAAEGRP